MARTEDFGESRNLGLISSSSASSSLTREQAELLALYQSSFDDEQVDHQLILGLLEYLAGEAPGAVLVFLPGYEDIMAIRSSTGREPFFRPRVKTFPLRGPPPPQTGT